MSFKKPFRAAPVRLGPHALGRRRHGRRAARAQILWLAVIGGVAAGAALSLAEKTRPQFLRQNAPAAGVYYPGCNAARAAGVAPIYRGEPGYRPELDGDDDGIACEPYRRF